MLIKWKSNSYKPRKIISRTRNSSKIHKDTLQDLRDQGCTDEELFGAIVVASLFNYMDRMADALGALLEGFQEMIKQMTDT